MGSQDALGIYSNRPLPVPPQRVVPQWATWIDQRHPEFKMHTGLGHAKGAITNAGHGLLYRWMEEQWICVAIVDKGQASRHPMLQPRVVPDEAIVTCEIFETP